jgi:glutamine amidotransferase
MISIINYGLGNLGSIVNMLKKVGFESRIISKPEDLNEATKIILPGVGSFDTGMNNLIYGGWIDILNKKVLEDKIPVLGICLGMQLMCNCSEEGTIPGLGWFNADVKKFKSDDYGFKIPHIGWNTIEQKKSSILFDEIFFERRYYFVHSYYVLAHNLDDILATTEYGLIYSSALQRNNLFGVQFHPEKSHKYGTSLLYNFAKIS